MARFKSGRLGSQLGIPVVNGACARPFLGVTREQISKMAKKIQLSWLDDESNRNMRFERNFLRSHILSPVRERFPGYLRHYATSSNELARKLGLWRGGDGSFFKQKTLPLGGVGLFHSRLENTFFGAEGAIRSIVENLSSGARGSLTRQVDRMVEAAARGRQGPVFFSGSVRGYMAPGVLFFIHSGDVGAWELYDRTIVRVLEEKGSLGDVPFRKMDRGDLIEHIGKMPFPPLGAGDGGEGWNPEGGDFLLPRTSSLFRRRGWKLKSLVKVARGMNKTGKKSQILPLDLLAGMGNFCCTKSI